MITAKRTLTLTMGHGNEHINLAMFHCHILEHEDIGKMGSLAYHGHDDVMEYCDDIA